MTSLQHSSQWNVIAELENHGRQLVTLEPESNLFAGSSKHCGLILEGDDIEPLQCLITLESDTVYIQDWASQTGTLINGQSISAKTAVQPSDFVRIGSHVIQVARVQPVDTVALADVTGSEVDVEASTNEPAAREETATAELVTIAMDDPTARPVDAVQSCGEPGRESELDDALLLVNKQEEPEFADEDFETDCFNRETVELMQAEIEDLQAMLAQRDTQLETFLAEAGGDNLDRESVTANDQTEILLSRLQDLLDQAEGYDERVALLEDLLSAAEEAGQAEQEERLQLETWVGDIEQRVSQREEEWKAEGDVLRQQVQRAISERNRVQHQLKTAASQGIAPAAYEETLNRLQQQNSVLQQELDDASKESIVLAQKLKRSENQEDESLREERALIARERAEVSRLKFELQQKMNEAEAIPQPKEQPDREFTDRLKMLREHLREIHEEERQEREVTESKLTSRISKLWKRLEY